jgi:HK97 family phage portal protein
MVGFPTGATSSGVLPYGVSATTAVGLSAVWRCLDVLGTGVSQLAWTEHRGTLELPLSRLARRPSAFYTRREWVQLVVRTMALYDVCYLLKLDPLDSEGVPMGLWPIPPQIITPRVIDTYMLTPPTSYLVGRTVVDAEHIIAIRRGPLPGVPDYLSGLLQMARAEFAGAIAQANYTSRYWQSGGPPTTVLTTDANLSDPQATALGNRWAQRRSQGPDHPAVLSNGLKAQEYGADPTTQSAVEAGRDQVAGVARYFGIPARMANAPSIDSQTYKTSQEENLDLVHYTLQNYIGAIEDAITDLLPGNRTMSMNSSVLTEGTQYARAQSWQLALGSAGSPGWMTRPEVREAEGLPPEEMEMMGMPIEDKPIEPANPMPSQAVVAATTGRPS